MRRALFVVALLAGCKGELNPTYCAEHREDPDCLNSGVTLLDAAAPECATSADCAGNPEGGVCDTEARQCVACIVGVDVSACTGATPVCGQDRTCHGCVADGDCASGVCLPAQSCAMPDDILYAAPAGSGTQCTTASPCTLTTAVAQLSLARHVIKLAAGTYTDAPITIDETFGVQIIGTGAEFEPEGDGDAITASGANLEIVGLTISEPGGSGVRCTAGLLTLRAMTIEDSDAYGVYADGGCNTTITRTLLREHAQGAIRLDGGTHEVRNNILVENGNENLETGAIRVRDATGRVRFNTIVRSISRSGGGGRVGGISCTEASSGAFAVAQNIVAAWGNANDAIGGDCTVRDNYVTQMINNVRFTPDFHLTAQSPSPAVRDDPSVVVDADCTINGQKIEDFDGNIRPYNGFCDRGADEYSP